MPTRRAALAAFGISVGLAGCLDGPPELDPQLPGFEEAENGTADGEDDPFAGIVSGSRRSRIRVRPSTSS